MKGPTERTCRADGKWDRMTTSTVCFPRSCPKMDSPKNGNTHCPNGLTYQKTCISTCNVGHYLVPPSSAGDKKYVVNGKVVRPCGADGKWKGVPAESRVARCPPRASMVMTIVLRAMITKTFAHSNV